MLSVNVCGLFLWRGVLWKGFTKFCYQRALQNAKYSANLSFDEWVVDELSYLKFRRRPEQSSRSTKINSFSKRKNDFDGFFENSLDADKQKLSLELVRHHLKIWFIDHVFLSHSLWVFFTLLLTLTHSHTRSLKHTYSHSHAHVLKHTRSLNLMHTLALSTSCTHSLSQPHAHTRSLNLTHTLALSHD